MHPLIPPMIYARELKCMDTCIARTQTHTPLGHIHRPTHIITYAMDGHLNIHSDGFFLVVMNYSGTSPYGHLNSKKTSQLQSPWLNPKLYSPLQITPCNKITSELRSLLPSPVGDLNSEVPLYTSSLGACHEDLYVPIFERGCNGHYYIIIVYQTHMCDVHKLSLKDSNWVQHRNSPISCEVGERARTHACTLTHTHTHIRTHARTYTCTHYIWDFFTTPPTCGRTCERAVRGC